MASATEICNLALSHLGVAKEIANLETERSPEAAACRRFYDLAIKAIFRDFPWPFATQIQALALVETSPNSEWGYSYRMPSDCASFRRILSGQRVDTPETRVPYRVIQDSAGQLILSDQPNVVGEYTIFIDDPARFPSDFVLAAALRLAALIAPRVTAGDQFKLGQQAFQAYLYFMSVAKTSALHEEQPDASPLSEFTRARD